MDIGGGSTEFIHADATGMLRAESLDIGVSRIYQLLDQPLEYTAIQLEQINSYLEAQKGDFFNSFKASVLNSYFANVISKMSRTLINVNMKY